MIFKQPISRRTLLKTSATGAAIAARIFLALQPGHGRRPHGRLHLCRPKDDYGYNQSHAEGAAVVKKMPGVTVVEEENVPETGRCVEDHGIHDQSRRRDAAFPDILRLFRPIHAR